MQQVYGRRRTAQTEKDTRSTWALRLFVCALLFAAAALCKNSLPTEYRQALLTGIDSGPTFREVLAFFGESATSAEALSRFWNEGVLKIFGFGGEEYEVSGDNIDAVLGEDEDFDKLALLDLTKSVTIPVFHEDDTDLTVGAEPSAPTLTEPESPDISAQELSEPEEKADMSDEPDEGADPPLPDVVSTEAVSIPFNYVTPVYGTFTSGFGYRDHPIDGEYKFHYGVDIAAAEGTAVAAFADGTVSFAGWGDINGYYIKIEHDGGFVTLYAHLDEIKVKKGETVRAGDTVGLVGETGEASGSHLHFQLYSGGKLVDPSPFLNLNF